MSLLTNYQSYPPLRPVAPVEVAIADGLGDVLALNLLAAGEVGDGAGHLEDAAVGAGREFEVLHGRAKHVEAGGVGLCELVEHSLAHLCIGVDALVGLEAFLLHLPCLQDSLADGPSTTPRPTSAKGP